MSVPHVWITGLGCISPLGLGHAAFADALLAARGGIGDCTRFDPAPAAAALAAEVQGFDVNDWLAAPKTYLDPAAEFALAALRQASDDAGVDLRSVNPLRAGLVLGTAWGAQTTADVCLRDLLTRGPRAMKPFLFPHAYSNTPVSLCAIETGCLGHHSNHAAGGAASTWALLEAFDRIRLGRADLLFAGGTEALNETVFRCMEADGRLSPGDGVSAERLAPFDEGRNGAILGEGAAVLALENAATAHARGATPLALVAALEIAALPPDATPADVAALYRRALAAAGGAPPAAIFASANGDTRGDALEAAALASVASACAVAAIKGAIGEPLGAAGAFLVAAAAACLVRGRLPPTLGLVRPAACAAGLRFHTEATPLLPGPILVSLLDPDGAMAAVVLRPATTPAPPPTP